MSVRSDIVDALKTVPELAPTPNKPDNIVAWMAWPAWDSNVPLTGCGDTETWFVYVALPAANTATTVTAGDDIRMTVRDALAGVGKYLRCENWSIPVEPGQQGVPVIRYTLEV